MFICPLEYGGIDQLRWTMNTFWLKSRGRVRKIAANFLPGRLQAIKITSASDQVFYDGMVIAARGRLHGDEFIVAAEMKGGGTTMGSPQKKVPTTIRQPACAN